MMYELQICKPAHEQLDLQFANKENENIAVKRYWLKYLIAALICLPVFVINIKHSHDWGDDFAQYIHQAKNITTGTSQQQTGYIYIPEFLHLGPPTYPVGFPLLLAPVYAMFGNSVWHFDIYTSFFLF